MFRRYRYDEVLFIKAKERYTEIAVLSDEDKGFTTHTTSSSLKNLTDLLPGDLFLRVHKSYTVNLKKVTHYRPDCELLTVEVVKKAIPVGSGYKCELLKRLGIDLCRMPATPGRGGGIKGASNKILVLLLCR